jgi:hypothetical protein
MGSNTIVYHLTQVGALLYAATNTGIYTSSNNGLNWTAMPGVNYTVFGVAAAGSDLVMVSTFGVKYSTNNGSTWNDATGTPTSLADGEIIGYDAKVFVIVPNQTGIYRSIDNGASFAAYNGGVSVIDLVSLEEFFADGSLLYVGSFTDIYSTVGSTVAVEESAAAPSAYLYPTVFENGFTAVMPEGQAQVSLVLFDAQGREALRVDGLGAGEHRIERGDLKAGTYRCVVEGVDGRRRGRGGHRDRPLSAAFRRAGFKPLSYRSNTLRKWPPVPSFLSPSSSRHRCWRSHAWSPTPIPPLRLR